MTDRLAPERLRELLSRLDGSKEAASNLSTWLSRIEASWRDQPVAPEPPGATAPSGRPVKLTIGMAVHDDFDGAYFTAQAIRLFHPEVADRTEILVVDNNPTGPDAAALKALERSIARYRYVPYDRWPGTAVRDVVFREAGGEYVLCLDSHVLVGPGALAKLLDYFEQSPETIDLLQGPMVYDDMSNFASHMNAAWRGGMFGTWAMDSRASDPEGRAFEVPMHGLGLFACRRDVWPGFNPRFTGFGGEEGYLHEKFRQRGGRTLCLPFLRWLHRFQRPRALSYRNVWEDRIRNYVIGFSELGIDLEPVRAHFTEILGEEPARQLFELACRDLCNPFSYFDGIYLINLDHATGRRQQMARRFEALGIDWRVRRFPAIATPDNHHIGCALSHRAVIEEAKRLGLKHVLVFEDDCQFLDDALQLVADAIAELDRVEWSMMYLGACRWNRPPFEITGLQRLVRPNVWTCSHAIAYAQRAYDALLDTLPPTIEGMAAWLQREHGIDQYFARHWSGKAVAVRPSPVTQGSILAQEDAELRDRYI